MKTKYTAPSLEVLLLQSAQPLANSQNDLKNLEFTGPSSFPQGGPEIDIPLN